MTGIPSNEKIWFQRTTTNGKHYCITSKASRDIYYIYEVIDGKATKLGKGATPPVLEEKFIKE